MRVIVNADDFGLSPETVAATIDCLSSGVATSASIMAQMPATEEAIAYALAHPERSYGIHLTFVGEGAERPVSPAADVAALVTTGGSFPSTRVVRRRAVLRRLPRDQLEREIAAQIAAVSDRGVPLSHVDSHRHLHKFAAFRAALAAVLPRFGIRRVRTAQNVYLRRRPSSPTYWLGSAWSRALARSFVTTERFYMPAGIDAVWAEPLANLLPSFRPGDVLEVGIHPGTDEGWRASEAAEARAFAALARRGGHELIGWDEIAR